MHYRILEVFKHYNKLFYLVQFKDDKLYLLLPYKV